MALYASTTVIFFSSIFIGLCFLAGSGLKEQIAAKLDESNERQKNLPADEGIPPSCTFDAHVLCDPTVHPVQALMNQDPFVRLIMIPLEQPSPKSSTMMLDNFFTASAGNHQLSLSSLEHEDAILGSMLEDMMRSAMRLSVAAEEMTSSVYYGTKESAAEETFTTMLTSFLDLSDTSTGSDQYYYDSDQLRKKVCSYGQTMLDNENRSIGDGNETRQRLARRLGEVDQGPVSPNAVVTMPHGSVENEIPFVSSIRIITFEEIHDVTPSKSESFIMQDETKQCLWDAYHAGEVSYPCALEMNAIKMSMSIGAADLFENYTHLRLPNFIIGLVVILLCMATCYSSNCEEEEMDDLEMSENEYHEMSENTMMESVHTGVPLTMPLRVV